MNCPHCGKPIPPNVELVKQLATAVSNHKYWKRRAEIAEHEISPTVAAKALRSIKSESRAKASRENGMLGGARPKYPQCSRYNYHRFVNDRCPCGYER